ncbi:pilus assembly PilX family protein [Teredinibacter turnerae]|uniref:pilus assembly PilX family protein n=1 Tax=Teredinibacter turnerae TaxID=2426 RepID=UPI0005F8058D|nr:pilus assembly protein [Teredinibacter turnerae]
MNRASNAKNQQGATLAVTLVLLLIVSVLGISAVQSSLVEEKMSGNLRDKHIAFEAAESALTVAEAWLDERENYPTPTAAGTNRVWNFGSPGNSEWWHSNPVSWWTNNAINAPTNTLQQAAPRYIIEERAFTQRGENLTIGTGAVRQGKYYYQVTSRGNGGSANTQVHLRTTFVKRYD